MELIAYYIIAFTVVGVVGILYLLLRLERRVDQALFKMHMLTTFAHAEALTTATLALSLFLPENEEKLHDFQETWRSAEKLYEWDKMTREIGVVEAYNTAASFGQIASSNSIPRRVQTPPTS